MSTPTYCRIGGHLLMLYCLTVPLADMHSLLEKYSKGNPDLRRFKDLGPRFCTVWNVIFQLFYASAALMMDVTSLLGKDKIIPAALKRYRHIFFSGIIFPLVCGVQMFWIVYFYDQELVFKKTLKVAVSQKVNFIVHGLVLVYALWELVFLPKDVLKKNKASWIHLHVFNIVYLISTFYTRYIDMGIWPYDVLAAATGSLMLPVILLSVWSLSTLGYHLQWYLRNLIDGRPRGKVVQNGVKLQ